MRHWPTYRCCSVVNVYRHRPVKAKAPWSEDDRRCDSSVFHVLSVYVNGNRFLNVLQEHLWNCDVTSIEPPWSTLGIFVIIIHTSTNLNETLTDVPLLLRGQRLRAQTGKWRTPQWSDDDRRRGSSVFHVLPVSPQLTGTVPGNCFPVNGPSLSEQYCHRRWPSKVTANGQLPTYGSSSHLGAIRCDVDLLSKQYLLIDLILPGKE